MSGLKISQLPSGVPTLSGIIPFTNDAKTETFYGTVNDFVSLTPLTQDNATLVSGSGNNYNPGVTSDIVRISGTSTPVLTGLSSSGYPNDAGLFINVGSGDITIKHNNSSSDAVNRFLVSWAGDYVMSPSGGATLVIRDKTDNIWRIV
jgi:hypothetical protein